MYQPDFIQSDFHRYAFLGYRTHDLDIAKTYFCLFLRVVLSERQRFKERAVGR